MDFDEYRQAYQYSNMAVAAAAAAAAVPAAAAAAAAPAGLAAIAPGPPIPFTGALVPHLTAVFLAAIAAAFPQLAYTPKAASIVTRSKHFGDFQCNSSMEIFKLAKAAGLAGLAKPADVGAAIGAAAAALGYVGGGGARNVVASLSVAPQGFINVTVNAAVLFAGCAATVARGGIPPPPLAQRRRVAVDFSSPNIAKEMHVGHLRSTIIGDTICRVLEFAGHEVGGRGFSSSRGTWCVCGGAGGEPLPRETIRTLALVPTRTCTHTHTHARTHTHTDTS